MRAQKITSSAIQLIYTADLSFGSFKGQAEGLLLEKTGKEWEVTKYEPTAPKRHSMVEVICGSDRWRGDETTTVRGDKLLKLFKI
jgi:hypothetical protein